jgi:hypothetical protein
MRTLFGVGTPRGLQDGLGAMLAMLIAFSARVLGGWRDVVSALVDRPPNRAPHHRVEHPTVSVSGTLLATGC